MFEISLNGLIKENATGKCQRKYIVSSENVKVYSKLLLCS
jgi:hypothetical protein